MKNKCLIFLFFMFGLFSLAACAGSTPTVDLTDASATLEPTLAAPAVSYTDPYAYCAAVGQIDAPDARYTGPTMSDNLFKDYLIAAGLDPSTDYPDSFKQMTIWRCMDSQVYACNFGANIPCNSKADTDQTPTQAMNEFCTQNPDNTFIPMSVTGHSTIYNWYCDQTTAAILDQFDTVDVAGYQSNFWTPLVENAAPANSTTQPAADATPATKSKTIVFYSNRDGGMNNIFQFTIGSSSTFILTQGQDSYFTGPYSPDGNRILFTGFGLTNSYVGVMNADGSNPMNITNQTDSDDSFPAWYPDGTQIVFTSYRDGNNEIYVMDSSGDQLKRLTNNSLDDFSPSWSPDGKKIAFLSDRENQVGVYSIYLMNSDGSGVTRLTNDKGNDYTPRWSPDGSKIIFRSIQNGQSDIFTVNTDGSGMTNLTNHPGEDWSPAWSMDGSQIAFQSDRDGNWEIYIMNADGSDQTNVTNDPSDDQSPYWKP